MPVWGFERRKNGDAVVMVRELEMKEVDGDAEATRKAERRMRCLQFSLD